MDPQKHGTPPSMASVGVDALASPNLNGGSDVENPTNASTDAPYSTFTLTQKKLIVLMASVAAFFSPLSANMYLPALNVIASDLHVSSTLINLTITTYLIMQGLAPVIIAGFADGAGRRPAYIVCFVVYIAANIGLALQNSYAALMVLRCIQSGGISATLALGNGVVADVAAPSERGSYIGYTALGMILGPIIGPTIGGFIAQYLGWHWIFWICGISGGLFFVALALLLPETCRKIVGDGSITPPKLNVSLASILREKGRAKSGVAMDAVQQAELRQNYQLRFPNPLSTLVLLKDGSIAIILASNALSYAAVFAITAGAPSQFQEVYHLNAGTLGLVFIPFGVGSIVAAVTTGIIINWNFQRHALRLNMPMARNRHQDLSDFPIEKARLEIALPLFYVGAAAMIVYGWVLQFQTNLAGPLVMLFVMGWSLVSASQAISVLMVDIYPERAAGVTAAGNLSRCLLAAGSSAVIVPMIDAMGKGWAYTVTSLAWVVFSPLLWVLVVRGHGWRKQRKEADLAKVESVETHSSETNRFENELTTEVRVLKPHGKRETPSVET